MTVAWNTSASTRRRPRFLDAPPVTSTVVIASPIQSECRRMLNACASTTARAAAAPSCPATNTSLPYQRGEASSRRGVISGTKYGSSMLPALPGLVLSTMAAAKSSQERPKRRAISSRASEPFEKHASAMNPPAGLPNTLP